MLHSSIYSNDDTINDPRTISWQQIEIFVPFKYEIRRYLEPALGPGLGFPYASQIVSSARLTMAENLEYNLVKSIIKENTTAGGAKAISIPGQGDEVEHAFEDKVLKTLVDNHNRISLFVKSKCGEIESRLSTCVRIYAASANVQIISKNNYTTWSSAPGPRRGHRSRFPLRGWPSI
jgi:hypothetical protein